MPRFQHVSIWMDTTELVQSFISGVEDRRVGAKLGPELKKKSRLDYFPETTKHFYRLKLLTAAGAHLFYTNIFTNVAANPETPLPLKNER